MGTRYLFETLRDCGFSDVAWDVITQKSYPGWGYMVAEGATTLWERWEKLAGMGMNSHNHIMFGSVDAWFYRSLGGIIPLAAGWKRVRVAPKTPGSLSHASASQMTPRGRISVSWSRSPWLRGDGSARHASLSPGGGEFRLGVSIPDGVEAEIEIPYAELGQSLTESGVLVWTSSGPESGVLPAGIRCIERRGEILALGAGSGDYEFTMAG